MAWPLTGASWSTAATFGFGVVARVEDAHGHLPAPGTPPQRPEAHAEEAERDRWLAGAYHTIYVMGLLSAAALHPGRAPPRRIPRRVPSDRGTADAILRFLDSDGPKPRWRHEIDAGSPAERESLAGLLLNIALYRKIRRREFDAVLELLRIGYRSGLADAPASSQCAELLERLAVFERLTGVSRANVEPEPLPA